MEEGIGEEKTKVLSDFHIENLMTGILIQTRWCVVQTSLDQKASVEACSNKD
jgi:hypothetical protein